MAIPQNQLAQAFADWSAANPNATDADMSRAMQSAGVNPLELSLALGIDPNQGINRYNQAVQQNPLANPLIGNINSTGNPLLSATASTIGQSFINPASLTTSIGERAVPGALGGIMNFAAADDASGRKNDALNTLVSVIGGPAGTLFKAFLDQFGFFKGGSKAVNLTPEQQVEEAYKLFQDQSLQDQMEASRGGATEARAEGRDARLSSMISSAENIGLDTTDLRKQLKNDFGITSVPGDLPEGYVKDSQGFLRDVATRGYWILDNGNPKKTTPPLIDVPMPSADSGGGGGGATVSTSGATPSGSTGATVSEGISSTGAGEWRYDSKAGVFRQTGGIETIIPKEGTYTDGQVVSSKEMKDIFKVYGPNETTTDLTTPTDWASIFNKRGVGDVIAEMIRLKKSSDDVAKESGFSTAQVNQAISDYNSQVAAGTVTPGTGGTSGYTGVATKSTITGTGTIPDGGVGPVSGTSTTTGTNGKDGKDGIAGKDGTAGVAGVAGTAGTDGKDGKDGKDGRSGLITSLVNATPIASQLFKPELFKAENKVSGLFDLVMRTRA